MTTSDGQGINWKWLSGLLISIVGGLLIVLGTLAWSIRNEDTSKICALEVDVGKIKSDVSEIKNDQKWIMQSVRDHINK